MACRRRAAEPDVAAPITAVAVNDRAAGGSASDERIKVVCVKGGVCMKQSKGARMGIFRKVQMFGLAAMLLLTIGLVSACKVPEPDNSSGLRPSVDNGVEVVYFHNTIRCSSCIWKEDGIIWTIDTYFADEVANGKLVFMSIDWQDSNNSAIVNKYGAFGPQLFMNKVVNGEEQIEEITEAYFYVGNDQAFADAVKAAIEERLE
jgi:hypothetical protein